ncbi:hypothetical protein [Pseudobacteroides cellulosolvens]|uniref:Uncharacterized protein n=1 Tax=Pseudobacteroides cellulosolvens ATCC 35603 = DSM 2933 TaxID=398512 RepID=A0A0L6JH76_9FIRM|nr:hypothetical protein [Pseudobacteroides cellulosolvens]KNY24822.1 hypothetical protein Bccel_0079 [Pseudobacteroides cellulosolvens ATCC 35603 = DSM 2933]
MSLCKDCKAKINWILGESGNSIPVDTEEICIMPDNEGHVVIVKLDGQVVKGNLTMKGSPGSVIGYTNHYDTCRASRR